MGTPTSDTAVSRPDLGILVEAGDTKTVFTNPREERTQNYITGRIG